MHDHSHDPKPVSRRDALKSGLWVGAGALLAGRGGFHALELPANDLPRTAPRRPYLEETLRAEQWLARSAQRTAKGTAWPWDPTKPEDVQMTLYTGMPGVVLFYLELHHATREASALAQATAGADYIAASLPNDGSPAAAGLYEGLAGLAYTLEMTHRASGDARYRDAALRAHTMLKRAAHPVGNGVEWSESTDIISGSAGIGLYLLWAAAVFSDPEATALAIQAGKRLVERGQPERGGTKWMVSPQVTRNYPNFSHGTAGVSYFLATLHQASGDRAFLDAAKSGATYLDALMTPTARGGKMVFHSEPGNEKLFYLGWCHGPAGTARLYHRLDQITSNRMYRDRVKALAQAIRDMRVPERSPGFWNNFSRCCGNTGVAEFFVGLHRLTKDEKQIEFAKIVTSNTLMFSTPDGRAIKWVQAENRVSPNELIAQTGLMQGSAGVGIGLLHIDGADQKRKPFIVLPDDPYTD